MHERRKERRFNLQLPCLITVSGNSAHSDCHQADSLNISCGGAYLNLSKPFDIGIRIGIDLLVRLATDPDCRPHGSCISLKGEVVRRDPGGMAVKFDGLYQIASIDKFVADRRSRIQWLEMAAGDRSVDVPRPGKIKTRQSPGPKGICRIGAVAASAIRSFSNCRELNHQ